MTELGKSRGIPDVKSPAFEIALETNDVSSALEKAKIYAQSLFRMLEESRGVKPRLMYQIRMDAWLRSAHQ